MSDTPQTDARLNQTQGLFRASAAINGFAYFTRSLERQRNELLKALEKVWPFLEEDDHVGYNSPAYQEAINASRAAIAKAKEPLP